ncbi:MAG: DNA-binding protein Tfx [Methanosaeta sp. PtaU1.Bin060]|nr:MAG: DNA-binding protein Tfx [Methanosaeta sp. PtaU1.Bin060]
MDAAVFGMHALGNILFVRYSFITSVENTAGDMPRKLEAGKPDKIESYLTKRQVQVLQLRSQGRSQQEVAELMGTTRANISKLERRAHQNIKMAERTIHDWMKIQAPISLSIPKGTDILHVPGMVFKAADLKGIHLPVNAIDLLVQLKTEAPFLFKREALPNDVEIFITIEGQILLIDEKTRSSSHES